MIKNYLVLKTHYLEKEKEEGAAGEGMDAHSINGKI